MNQFSFQYYLSKLTGITVSIRSHCVSDRQKPGWSRFSLWYILPVR
jgi:hypothetical protein